ncbi:uncharacterized protein LOC135499483 isoform X1 [Lineus longissimus]|uniref:uncharacterized protein LOC135499483 isoform X1 n=1 Tax=Lineus longissimus TaxID=88925 RepID=UPI002B4E895D
MHYRISRPTCTWYCNDTPACINIDGPLFRPGKSLPRQHGVLLEGATRLPSGSTMQIRPYFGTWWWWPRAGDQSLPGCVSRNSSREYGRVSLSFCAVPLCQCLISCHPLLSYLGSVCGRGGGGGRGRGARVSAGGESGLTGANKSEITPEIVMYILVIIAFFILFLCFCLFKEPEEKDYFSAHEKEALKKSKDSDVEVVDNQPEVDNPV